MNARTKAVHRRVRHHYAEALQSAPRAEGCCDANYSEAELSAVPRGSVLGLGSGNPVRHAALRPGEVVVDLGSGAGVDVFLAARQVGPEGRAIGVDMTSEMVARARELADRDHIANASFLKGPIERLPLADAAADVVVSNCVINLSPDKEAVFREAFRVLRSGGRLVVSDIVQERPLDLQDDCGCVSNAAVREEYLRMVAEAGFVSLRIVDDAPAVRTGTRVDASAITLRAAKPKEAES